MDIEVLKDRRRILQNTARLLWKASHPGEDAAAVVESIELIGALASAVDAEITRAESAPAPAPEKPARTKRKAKK